MYIIASIVGEEILTKGTSFFKHFSHKRPSAHIYFVSCFPQYTQFFRLGKKPRKLINFKTNVDDISSLFSVLTNFCNYFNNSNSNRFSEIPLGTDLSIISKK